MKTRAAKTRGFRPWPENAERLAYAESLGISVTDIANELMRDHLKDYLKKKTEILKRTLAAPMP